MSDSLQNKIQSDYKSLLSILQKVHSSIEELSPSNEEIKKYVTTFKDILIKSIKETEKRILEIQTNMVWDHLVIAFFGSTNAGKSTIIETLRLKYQKDKDDLVGEIVGTGQPDFTEKFDEYTLSMKGNKLTIIDMPGILCNEEKYTKQIHDALNKAHIVLYVDRDGTKPDIETIKKIKSYLQDWVKVYTIYNVPGFVHSKDSLQSNNVKESASLIEAGYRSALGDCYAGNVILHAFYALASIANFTESRIDLIRKQTSAIKKFPSNDEMYAYSEFSTLIDLIAQQTNNYIEEIAAANLQRLNAIKTFTTSGLKEELQKKVQLQLEIPIELQRFKNDVGRYYDSAIADINSSYHAIITKHIRQLEEDCKHFVDCGAEGLEEKCNDQQEKEIRMISKDLEQAVAKIIKQLSANIDRRKNKIEGFVPDFRINVSYDPGQTRIDFEGAAECVKFNFEHIMDILGDMAVGATSGLAFGCVIPGVGNAVGMGIGAGIGLLKGLYSIFLGNSYKEKTKNAIQTAIEKMEQNLTDSMRKSVAKTTEKITIERNKNQKAIDDEISKINTAVQLVNDVCNKLIITNTIIV